MTPPGFNKRRAHAPARACGRMILFLAFIVTAENASSSSATCLPDVISEDAGRFIALLSSPVPERRVEGIQCLVNLKHWPAESAVLRLLEDSSPSVRREAVPELGRLGGARTVPRLIELLDDPSWEIRQNAWLGLARMTAQGFDGTAKGAWSKWWAESTLAQKEQALLSVASGTVARRQVPRSGPAGRLLRHQRPRRGGCAGPCCAAWRGPLLTVDEP